MHSMIVSRCSPNLDGFRAYSGVLGDRRARP
jgi:hypothetical protein